ncbi:MAG: hemolysin family protein [Oscillospiraceae bacterium]|jgi:CBS domain containing-hemolysin-like protein|nr:hemolysin family protein [Oscillospiraceae bacterium]
MTGDIILISVMLVLSAFFSFSETAFTSVSRIKLKYKADGGSQRAKTALAVLEKYDKALSTILIGNNVVNITLTAVATVLILSLLPGVIAERYGVLITTVIVTFLTLTFGDILPKTIARIKAEGFCLAFGGILRLIIIILTPVSAVFLFFQRRLARAFSKGEKAVSVTEQELLHFIEEIEDEGVLEEQESNLVQSALHFDETTAGEVLTPRVNIVAVSVNEDINKVRDVFLTEGYSRIPVYEKSIDHICGILNNKDFMRLYISGDNFSIRDIMQEAIYVTALMKISEVLKLMQKEKLHLAVVVDQYGGTEGLVTLEDIIEELVGEIWDEGDEVHSPIIFSADNIFEVSGELSVNDFNRYFRKREMSFEIISDSNTVGGWVFELFGRIPGEEDAIETEIFKITVLSLAERRIKKLRFEIVEAT